MQPYNERDIQRLEQRIEAIQANCTTLHDSDRRFAEDRARIQALEAKQVDNTRMHIEIVDRINQTLDTKIISGLKPITDLVSKLDGKIDTVDKKIDAVKDARSEANVTTLRYIIGVVVSFVLGSGAIGALQYLESVIKK